MREHPPLPAPLVRQARYQWLEGDESPAAGIDAQVLRSWRRSQAAGLTPNGRLHCSDNLAGIPLQRARALNHDLVNHSQPVMEYLFEQVRDSQSVVALADRKGMLMHTLGDLDFLGKAERVALMPGATWHESQRGTNAIGTALAEAGEVEIHGSEHFLERHGFLTCAAAPIRAATGELMGILDLSGDQRSRHPHTLGLVSTAARMIENNLVFASCRQHTLLQLHPRAEGIGTVAQGVLALSDGGWVVGANRRALELLGLGARDIGAEQFGHLFDLTMDQLMSMAGRAMRLPLKLTTVRGQVLYATVQSHGADVVSAPAPAAPAARASAASDALSELDTGDARWRSAADKARRIAGKSIALLLQGESGVGKELFARAVHDSSPQKNGPFVAINCAALPEHLIEAELFGYAPGAFTGARKEGASGRLREAHGGTLFLDEIGDMPLASQTRLLRVLQERKVTPLGAGHSIPVEFALICATHHHLREAADKGSFRSDLYYRINGLTVQLPALRDRTDFQALTQRLLHGVAGHGHLQIEADLLQALARHPWPGNLRQYASVLRTAVAMLDPEEVSLGWAHMPDDLLDELESQSAPIAAAVSAVPVHNLEQLSQAAMQQALELTHGNMSAAARRLGISRQTLYRKLQSRPSGDPANAG